MAGQKSRQKVREFQCVSLTLAGTKGAIRDPALVDNEAWYIANRCPFPVSEHGVKCYGCSRMLRVDEFGWPLPGVTVSDLKMKAE